MFVIKLACGLAAIAGVLWAVYAFENYSFARFRQRFFTARTLILSSIASSLLIAGYWLYGEAVATNGDDLNGVVLMTLGGMSVLAISAWNIHRTSPFLGATGTLLHGALFGVIGLLGPMALIVIVAAWGFLLALNFVRSERGEVNEEDFW
jgi:hypothetical protein